MTYAYVLVSQVNGVDTVIPKIYSLDEIEAMEESLGSWPDGTTAVEISCGDGSAAGYEDVILEQVMESAGTSCLLHMEAEDIFLEQYQSESEYIKHPGEGRLPVLRRTADLAVVQNQDKTKLVCVGEAYKLLVQTELIPLPFKAAKEFVRRQHRHNAPPQGHKFSIGLREKGKERLLGVAIASTPKARHRNDGFTLEINRVCTDTMYADICSKLYAAAVRTGKAMGYRCFITYTLPEESGSSVKAAGFEFTGRTKASAESSVFQYKLVSLRQEKDVTNIVDFLKRYDAYIAGMDEFCQADCPVRLNECLGAEYYSDFMEDVYKRLDEAIDLYEECIDAEGAVAMRERSSEKYYILKRFQEQFDRFYESIDVHRISDADVRILEEMDAKLAAGSLLPHIFAWAKDRNVRRAVDSGTFDEMFSEFCGDLIASKGDIQECKTGGPPPLPSCFTLYPLALDSIKN